MRSLIIFIILLEIFTTKLSSSEYLYLKTNFLENVTLQKLFHRKNAIFSLRIISTWQCPKLGFFVLLIMLSENLITNKKSIISPCSLYVYILHIHVKMCVYMYVRTCYDACMCSDVSTLDYSPQEFSQTLIRVALRGVCRCNWYL